MPAEKLTRMIWKDMCMLTENEPMGWLSRQLGYAIQRSMVEAMTRMTNKLVDLAAKSQ